jgi:DNA repair photolyase
MRSQRARWASRSQGFEEVVPSPIKYIERMFYGSSDSMEKTLIKARYPIQLGHASDPLQPLEKQHRITLKTLKILKDFEYPTIITTKWPGVLTEDPYLAAIDGLPLVVQCSISSEDQAMLGILEPRAPSWKRRIAALSALSDAGAHCILRLWPYLPDLAGNLEVLLASAYDTGVRTVQANFLKLLNAGNDRARFRSRLGYDLPDNSCMTWEQRGNFRIGDLASQEREVRRLEALCRDIGLEVLTCDDLTGTRDWRSCCGVDGLPGFRPVPWAYYVRGHKITDHTSYEEYMAGIDCPWGKEFQMEWNRGRLAKAVPGIEFHADDMTYSRCS